MICKQAMEDEEVAQSAYDLRGSGYTGQSRNDRAAYAARHGPARI
jgi:hypothetical protein